MTETAKAKKFIVKKLGRNTFAVKEFVTIVDAEDAHIMRSMLWTILEAKSPGGQVNCYVARNLGGGVFEYFHQRVTGAPAGELVQHINGNSLDNRKANLLRASNRVQEIE